MQLPEELRGSTFPSTPVVQLGTVTRASARLRNVQPEVNLDQSYEVLKIPKKNFDAVHTGIKSGFDGMDVDFPFCSVSIICFFDSRVP